MTRAEMVQDFFRLLQSLGRHMGGDRVAQHLLCLDLFEMRCWVRDHPDTLQPGPAGAAAT